MSNGARSDGKIGTSASHVSSRQTRTRVQKAAKVQEACACILPFYHQDQLSNHAICDASKGGRRRQRDTIRSSSDVYTTRYRGTTCAEEGKASKRAVESDAEAKMPDGVEFTVAEPIVDRKSVFIGRACPITHPSQVCALTCFVND